MEFRHLGNSGLKVSAIAYGNWLTHGSQVEEDAALACVRQALDEGITTFDTADVYANTKAESVLGRALKGERREGLEIFTKVYWPTGPGAQRPRAVPQAHPGVDRRLAAPAAHRLRRPLPGAPLRRRDAARGDDGGLRRRRALRQGALHRGVGVDGRPDPRAATRSPGSCTSRSSPTSRSTTCCGGSSRPRWCPTCEELGIGQIVWSPIAQGVLTGKYKPGSSRRPDRAPPTTRAGADMVARYLDRRRAEPGAAAAAAGRRGRADPGPARGRVDAAERQRLGGDHRRQPARAGHRERQGRRACSSTPTCSRRSTRSSTRWSSATRRKTRSPQRRDF